MQGSRTPSIWKNPLFYEITIPIGILIISIFFASSLDLAIARYFYHEDTKTFTHNAWTNFFYHWGVVPAELTGIASLVIYLFSFVVPSWKKWRKPALVMVLTMALGAGAIVHWVFKDHWGRPRPIQVDIFGGEKPFQPFYEPNLTMEISSYKSFPCGHCTMGFYFFALALVGKRLHSRTLFYGGIALTLILGIGLSVTRMAQGGHFFSDTLVAAIIMWLTAVICDWLVYSDIGEHERGH